ncbi:urea ABC transporter permease [Salinadaptatus halalkaliphilus]|uniref:Urea ABC transporter permease n=1 Tax=Salinadaptatus halalkaliphilus TaxID=2419781 RepID=A0A4S3TPQ6_9EURY|nr:urea ABC transporter permease [Salinadaptatus halalkaliphilus]THE66301.1 urea ABC transporter permease [Salinadaptatus halalkaliphilus]
MSSDSSASLAARLRAPFEGPNTIGNSNGFWASFGVAVLLLAIYPVLFGPYAAATSSVFLVYALLGVSLCFIWGFCGILSFGQVAFFGVAGYTFGIVAINLSSYTGVTLGIVAGIAVATLFAALLGYFMFYGGVRDVYVTIITLVVALVLHTFLGQTAGSEWAVGEAALGGFNGMVGIPDLGVGVGDVGITLDGAMHYYAALAALIATYLGLRVLVNSQFGYAMVATREDEARTEMFGYNTTFIKFVTFTIGGALAGLSGVLFVTWGNYIDPSEFAITAAAMPVIWASIGGRESIFGTIAAAIAIQWLELQLTGEWALVIVGSLLIIVMLAIPKGIAPGIRDLIVALQTRRQEPASDSPAPTEEVSD